MKDKFFSWFEAKEDEPAIDVVIIPMTKDKEPTVFKMNRNKFCFIVVPAVVLASAAILYFFTLFVFALGLVLLASALAYIGTVAYDSLTKKDPVAADPDSETAPTSTEATNSAESDKGDSRSRENGDFAGATN